MEKVRIVTIVTMSLVVMATCRFESYDIEEKAGTVTQIIHWLNDICGAEHDQITGTDWKTFNTHLKDGVMLCVLINKLLEADGKSLVPIQKGAKSPFFAVDNIKNFNKGCIDYGMAEELTFQTGDLLDLKKDKFINVLHCLHNLGLIALGDPHQLTSGHNIIIIRHGEIFLVLGTSLFLVAIYLYSKLEVVDIFLYSKFEANSKRNQLRYSGEMSNTTEMDYFA